ncbi:hypothetical protein Dimus_024934 [Dionaea muscipula]
MEGKPVQGSNLPPGFRFHPTDEELIIHYLKNQATSRPCPVSIIHEVDIYKFDPWELPDKTEFGENEWYFFTPRDRKYPNGIRPNRATRSGYWKATGTDKAIYSGAKYVGIKKALVFYQGRPPKGNKTDWIMHEYRLSDSRAQPLRHQQQERGSPSSMRLDDWVLCRIYKKRHAGRTVEEYQRGDIHIQKEEEEEEDSQSQSHGQYSPLITSPANGVGHGASSSSSLSQDHHQQQQQQQVLKFPRTVSLAHLLDTADYLGPITHLLNESNPFSSAFEFQSASFGDHGFDPNINIRQQEEEEEEKLRAFISW